jgi:hypothetical protein
MGSGESDVKSITINQSHLKNFSGTGYSDNIASFGYSWGPKIYLYQIKCPKTGCKKFNWLELDKITGCYNCGAKLKAVLEEPDFTIPVQR